MLASNQESLNSDRLAQGQYDGTVSIAVITGAGAVTYGTGALLRSGQHILTAAHLFDALTSGAGGDPDARIVVTFLQLPGQPAFVVPPAGIHIPQGYSAESGPAEFKNDDLAILDLGTQAPAEADRYEIYTGSDEVLKSFVKVGFGRTGDGKTGDVAANADRAGYAGSNVYDRLADELRPGISAGKQLFYDFDDGTPGANAFGDAGLGANSEAFVAPGDSGGPAFVDGKIAGVTSYGLRNAPWKASDIDGIYNHSFGEIAVDTRVSEYRDWIEVILSGYRLNPNVLVTADTTPTLNGWLGAPLSPGYGFSVTLTGPALGDARITLTAGSASLAIDGNGGWRATVPDDAALPLGEYDATAILTDAEGRIVQQATTPRAVTVKDPVELYKPVVHALVTADTTPTIVGDLGAPAPEGYAFSVAVGDRVYRAGEGALQVAADGRWTLTVPEADALPAGVYDVRSSLSRDGLTATDATAEELRIDPNSLTQYRPVAYPLITADDTPLLSGDLGFPLQPGHGLTVKAGGAAYVYGTDGALQVDAQGRWSLQIPSASPSLGVQDIEVVVDNGAGGQSVRDAGRDELTVDPDSLTQYLPWINPNRTLSNTPVLTGGLGAPLQAGHKLVVEANGIVLDRYPGGAGALLVDDAGNWSLSTPPNQSVAPGNYSVKLTVANTGGQKTVELTGRDALTVLPSDGLDRYGPTADAKTSADDTPTLTGGLGAELQADHVLTVTANGVVHSVGDGALQVSGDRWTLSLPDSEKLLPGTYDIVVRIANANRYVEDATQGELRIDPEALDAYRPQVDVLATPFEHPRLTGSLGDGLASGHSFKLRLVGEGVSREYVYDGNGASFDLRNDGSWHFDIPVEDRLNPGVYDVQLEIGNGHAVATDSGVGELKIVGQDSLDQYRLKVDAVVTPDSTPVLTGSLGNHLQDGLRFTVNVNGKSYTPGDGATSLTWSGEWSVTVPDADGLSLGDYEVRAEIERLSDGAKLADESRDELHIVAPDNVTERLYATTIFTLSTIDTTPTIRGWLGTPLRDGDTLSVALNGKTYSSAHGDFRLSDYEWTLTIPDQDALVQGVYDLDLSIDNGKGQTLRDGSRNELNVVAPDSLGQYEPYTISISTADTTPTVWGWLGARLYSAHTLTVTVDGKQYVYAPGADGPLHLSADGHWSLDIPDPLPGPGAYEVEVVVADGKGGQVHDRGQSELTVVDPDSMTQYGPGFFGGVTADPTPELNGWVGMLSPSHILKVVVSGNGLTREYSYSAGDPIGSSELRPNDGYWHLVIPDRDALPPGVYDVTVGVRNPATGAEVSRGSAAALTIDPHSLAGYRPTINPIVTGDPTPTLYGGFGMDLQAGFGAEIAIDDHVYKLGDGALHAYNGSLGWVFATPSNRPLSPGYHQVTLSVVAPNGDRVHDVTVNEIFVNPDSLDVYAPRVDSQVTADAAPVLTGSIGLDLLPGHSFALEVSGNGKNYRYTPGDGWLTLNSGGAWRLDIPDARALTPGVYEVKAAVRNAIDDEVFDTGREDLNILDANSVRQYSPGMPSIATPDTTPTVWGWLTVPLKPGHTLSVELDGNGKSLVYRQGEGVLKLRDDLNTWWLDIPDNDALVTGRYEVKVLVGEAGQAPQVFSIGERLTVVAPDSLDRYEPTAVAMTTADATPTLYGWFGNPLYAGHTAKLEVNGKTYAYPGDSVFKVHDTGWWDLTLPGDDALRPGVYDISLSVSDLAGHSVADRSEKELTVVDPDSLQQYGIGMYTFLTADATPDIWGWLGSPLLAGHILSVDLSGNGKLYHYEPGDGILTLNAERSAWGLSVPAKDTLAPGTYDVQVTIRGADNTHVVHDSALNELTVNPDTLSQYRPSVAAQSTPDRTPTVEGGLYAHLQPDHIMTAEIGGRLYSTADGSISIAESSGNIVWRLTVPDAHPLDPGVYDVKVSIRNALGDTVTDGTTAELVVDPNTLSIYTPSVNYPVSTSNTMPYLSGWLGAPLWPGYFASVEIDGHVYRSDLADSPLHVFGGHWDLTIPEQDKFSVSGVYDVSVKVFNASGAAVSDLTSGELTIDFGTLSDYAAWIDGPRFSSDTKPGLWGAFGHPLAPGHSFAVEVKDRATGQAYDYPYDPAGPASPILQTNEWGGWSFVLPDALPLGIYDISLIVKNAQGQDIRIVRPEPLEIVAPDSIKLYRPGLDYQIRSTGTPTIGGGLGSALAEGHAFGVTVDGVTYTYSPDTPGPLTLHTDRFWWELTIPDEHRLAPGLYDVAVYVRNPATGESAADTTRNELYVYDPQSIPAYAPTVHAQTSYDNSPAITGELGALPLPGYTVSVWFADAPGKVYTATVDKNSYLGIYNDTQTGKSVWKLNVPAADALTAGVHDVVVQVTQSAYNLLVAGDVTVGEIEIVAPPPGSPTVQDQTTYNLVPGLSGQLAAALRPGDVFQVYIGKSDRPSDKTVYTYVAGQTNDGPLQVNGTFWSLDIPADRRLSIGIYDVDAIVRNAGGEAWIDGSREELAILPPGGTIGDLKDAIAASNALGNGNVAYILTDSEDWREGQPLALGGIFQQPLQAGQIFSVTVGGQTYTYDPGTFGPLAVDGLRWKLDLPAGLRAGEHPVTTRVGYGDAGATSGLRQDTLTVRGNAAQGETGGSETAGNGGGNANAGADNGSGGGIPDTGNATAGNADPNGQTGAGGSGDVPTGGADTGNSADDAGTNDDSGGAGADTVKPDAGGETPGGANDAGDDANVGGGSADPNAGNAANSGENGGATQPGGGNPGADPDTGGADTGKPSDPGNASNPSGGAEEPNAGNASAIDADPGNGADTPSVGSDEPEAGNGDAVETNAGGNDNAGGGGEIGPSVEDEVPSLNGGVPGDGNGDGVADKLQANVASLPADVSPLGSAAFVTLVDTQGHPLSGVQALPVPANLPGNLSFPLGLYDFRIDQIETGGTTNVSLFVDASISANGYWKQNPATGLWQNLATAVEKVGTKIRIDFALQDGGPFDDDGLANGTIRDPGGPAFWQENRAPRLVFPLPDLSVEEGQGFSFALPPGSFADPDAGDVLRYAATLGDGAALPGWLRFDAATGRFSGTPGAGEAGALEILAVASDGSGARASDAFLLTVNRSAAAAAERPPELAFPLPSLDAREDEAFAYRIPDGAFVDPDADDALAYAAAREDGAALPAWLGFDAATRTFSGTPGEGDAGTLRVRATATDRFGASASGVIVLSVAGVEDAPVAVLPPADASVEAGRAFSFRIEEGAFADPDAGDALSYAARLADGSALPAWLGFDAATRTFSGTPGNADGGVWAIEVVATDRAGSSAREVFALTVAPRVILGTPGRDLFRGSGEDDWYRVDHPRDKILESPAGGLDRALSAVGRALEANVEELVLLDEGGAIDGKGNGLDNRLQGNGSANRLDGLGGNDALLGGGGDDALRGGPGDDRLSGEAGADFLAGGPGRDIFVLDGAGPDRIADFRSGQDRVELAASVWPTDAKLELSVLSVKLANAADASSVAAAIGEIEAPDATGEATLFLARDGKGSALYVFRPTDAGPAVEAEELTLLAVFAHVQTLGVADFVAG